jgi:hypothetical protein
MGKRSAAVGFVIEVANTLLQAADASNQELHCAALAAVLDSSDGWQGSIQQQGAIHSLLQVGRCGTVWVWLFNLYSDWKLWSSPASTAGFAETYVAYGLLQLGWFAMLHAELCLQRWQPTGAPGSSVGQAGQEVWKRHSDG